MPSNSKTFAASAEMLSLLEHSERSMMMMDAQYRILWFNEQAARSMGRFFGEEVKSGYTYWDYADHDNGKRFIRNFELALKGRKVSVERRVESVKDDNLWIEATFSPLRSENNTITGVIYSFQDISQRKRDEQEALHRNNIVRAIDNNESQAFVLVDSENRLVSSNQMAATIMLNGDTKENMILERIDPLWRERFDGGLRVARTGGTVVIEFERMARKPRTLEIRFCPVNAKDEASMVSVWAIDITDKKKAERELRHSEENLRSVFNSSSQTFYLLDKELKILAFNEAAAELVQQQYGQTLRVGSSVTDITPSDRMPQFLAEAKRAFDGKKVEVEKHFANNGREYWFERHINPIRNKDGLVDRIAFWSIDITNRKRAEEALRENEAKFRQLAAIMPVGIYQTDANSNTVYVNESIRKIIPVPVCDLLSGAWKSIIHPEDFESISAAWKQVERSHTPYQMEYRLQLPNGKVTHVLEQAIPIFNHQKQYTGHLGSLIDLTVQRANQQLQQQKDVAERSLKFRSDFLASMSHEIRTPLTGILAISELLLESGLDDKHRDQVLNIHNASEDLRSIVNDVLHLSELEAGKVIVKEDSFTPDELLNTITKRYAPEATAKHIVLTAENRCEGITLQTDKRRLTQILSNLTRNAIKFTEKGTVRIVMTQQEANVRFEVHDTGIGIPKDDLPKLFVEFSQLGHTTAQNLEGTGLGLSITRKLTAMLGGTVGAESEYGKGSMFWVEVPATFKTVDTGAKQPLAKAASTSTIRTPRVLLVEDNLINQQAFKVMLGKVGCLVTTATNGAEAVKIFSPDKFDLIFMDIQMPVMDGIAASRKIKAKGGDVPIIGLSGNILELDDDGRPQGHMDDLLVKPVNSQELSRKVKQWFPTHRK